MNYLPNPTVKKKFYPLWHKYLNAPMNCLNNIGSSTYLFSSSSYWYCFNKCYWRIVDKHLIFPQNLNFIFDLTKYSMIWWSIQWFEVLRYSIPRKEAIFPRSVISILDLIATLKLSISILQLHTTTRSSTCKHMKSVCFLHCSFTYTSCSTFHFFTFAQQWTFIFSCSMLLRHALCHINL